MSYDNAGNFRCTYNLTLANATAAAAASIRVPTHLGVRAVAIEDIQFTPTVAIVNTTAAMLVAFGVTGALTRFANQAVGTTAGLAVGTTYGVADADGRVAIYSPNSAAGKGFIDLFNDGVTAGTLQTSLLISTTQGTGTPAGTVAMAVTLRWF